MLLKLLEGCWQTHHHQPTHRVDSNIILVKNNLNIYLCLFDCWQWHILVFISCFTKASCDSSNQIVELCIIMMTVRLLDSKNLSTLDVVIDTLMEDRRWNVQPRQHCRLYVTSSSLSPLWHYCSFIFFSNTGGYLCFIYTSE